MTRRGNGENNSCGENTSGEFQTGRWNSEEHERFLVGLQKYNKQWKLIADLIQTRTVVQVRTHAQKHFQKMARLEAQSAPSLTAKNDLRITATNKPCESISSIGSNLSISSMNSSLPTFVPSSPSQSKMEVPMDVDCYEEGENSHFNCLNDPSFHLASNSSFLSSNSSMNGYEGSPFISASNVSPLTTSTESVNNNSSFWQNLDDITTLQGLPDFDVPLNDHLLANENASDFFNGQISGPEEPRAAYFDYESGHGLSLEPLPLTYENVIRNDSSSPFYENDPELDSFVNCFLHSGNASFVA